jgi:antitoxin MazE
VAAVLAPIRCWLYNLVSHAEAAMQMQLARWGNSLAVRIPQPVARAMALTEGSRLEVAVEDGRIVLVPRPSAPPKLDALLAGITPENLPDETFDDVPVGREAL